jgi:N-acetylmuramoyl-L-alanine amidase
LVIYLNQQGKINTQSRSFAQIMQKALYHPGLIAQISGRNLAVLRGNQAQAEILVEIRNVHDKGEAWALRFHDKRDPDAERIFSGILNYVKTR